MFFRKKKVRVRIAPSPTGVLHVGTARAALFNWLFARKRNGVFVLRIEDTDHERSKKEYEDDIYRSLGWLGLTPDEGPIEGGKFGPYKQSERTEVYKNYIKKLLDENLAYYCFCTKEELDGLRRENREKGIAPIYNGRCREMSKADAEEKEQRGESCIIRFRTPSRKIIFKDLVRGEVEFDTSLFGDFGIAKDDETPLYNLAVVIDDYEMKISHVIRGEDHIPNTPKQILLQNALGVSSVTYAHLPLILGPDREKLSKRHGAVSVQEYRDDGFLPEALFNFLALMGWHPTGDQEIFSSEDLIKAFTMARVQKGGGLFDLEKLMWMNAEYIKKLDNTTLIQKLGVESSARAEKIIELLKPRMKKLSDFKELSGFFFELSSYDSNLLIWKKSQRGDILQNLKDTKDALSILEDGKFSEDATKEALTGLTQARGNGEILWPLRVALSGQKASPGPYEIMDILGRKETLARIDQAIKKLQ